MRKARKPKDQRLIHQLSLDEYDPYLFEDKERKESESRIYTVTELTGIIRSAIRDAIPETVFVRGEISNVSYASSGHIYFTLKDEFSQISCVIWRRNAKGLKFTLEDGLAVIAQGNVDIYSQRSQYQIYVEKIIPAGVGELELAFRQLKEKLEKRGLFDVEYKKAIPQYPLNIAVITSPTGAAIRDILRTLNRRWPIGRVIIYPVQVQGDQSAYEISSAINDLNTYAEKIGEIDVIILARGGGSLEDLWAFNEEIVAQAIFESKLPIITGIGHEIDVTIADLVADVRSATPTAAAQQATPLLKDVLISLAKLHQKLHSIVINSLSTKEQHLAHIQSRPMFRQPTNTLSAFIQRLDENIFKIRKSLDRKLHQTQLKIHQDSLLLQRISPNLLIVKCRHRLDTAEKGIHRSTNNYLSSHRVHLEHLSKRLENCDYKKVLKRGFAIVKSSSTGKIVKSIESVQLNSLYQTLLCDGEFESVVRSKKKHSH